MNPSITAGEALTPVVAGIQGPPHSFSLAVAHEEMNPRRRNTMEDCHRICPCLYDIPESNIVYSYFGVYDGHGGRQIVDFLEEKLEKRIATELAEPDEADVFERLTRSFLITDMESRKLNITTSGATAVSALLKTETSVEGTLLSRKLYVANVGDSRAVLVCQKGSNEGESVPGSGYYGRRLSYDHRAEDELEQNRIKEAGGFITKSRVLGILAVTRSFGDHGMKEFVIAEPFLSESDLLNCGDCPMLILACDGVWDVFSDQEAADFLLPKYKESGPFEDAASILVQAAIDRGSSDNITVIVIFL